jgi:hypothetical protein
VQKNKTKKQQQTLACHHLLSMHKNKTIKTTMNVEAHRRFLQLMKKKNT